ncbi:hypothetical protein [Dendronalium sp. ChiSLP03b]|uniref:hypothetical protein n=1 Tax=Dendronalium sp. ChiSLP03b TaxID=3075381 RepID=UPI002AD29A65|nr:hypothetical protein [Dendronalium sp. ChiSLP03b]MDZ8204623.1 hypothetical protein [Dendronalium sp. ChiSLP03b]
MKIWFSLTPLHPYTPTPTFKPGVRKKNYGLWILACSFWFVIISTNNSAFSQNLISSPAVKEVKSSCSEQSLEVLTTQLLRDLPSYANRASQRARRRSRSSEVYSYMLLAGKPEFQPLPLNPGGYTADGQKSAATGVEQVFFTTLERQYINQKAVELQEFHWLLLTKTKNGWRLVMMFTQTDSYPKQEPPSPPRDSSNGNIAQGVKAWLRDCQAGSVRMPTTNLRS